jgi:alkanesulfonate monooxygenase SsuD/methylene tetrahydromethanopterin reductase-like flavin-dependent oxidoreductase (luciferase family)
VNLELGIYIPQVAIDFDALLERARVCEELGFSFWLYDHLYAPGLPDQPALEGWTAATALLASTSTLTVGHLVLNNNFRHPALLARMATTLAVISGGRFELGLGSGSYEQEHTEGGFPWGPFSERTERLGESLAIIRAMFSNDRTTFEGAHYTVRDVPNLPRPGTPPRIHIGGAGARTLPLVARYADVWNVPTYALADWEAKEAELRRACDTVGRDPDTIALSLEAVLVLCADAQALPEARARAERRYAGPGWGLDAGGFVGTPAMIVERIAGLTARGVSSFVFFPSDRGREDTLRLLAEEVAPHVR